MKSNRKTKVRRDRRNETRRSRMMFESLEDRRLMAADIDFTDGILTIQGDSQNDYVEVQMIEKVNPELTFLGRHGQMPELHKTWVLEVRMGHIAPRSTTPVIYDTVSELAWQPSLVDKIVFHGAAGHDHFHNETDIPSELHGGSGVDHLHGGSAGDKLYGGSSTDFLYGNDGDDLLIGSWGHDKIDGGAGLDSTEAYVFSNAVVANNSLTRFFYSWSETDTLTSIEHVKLQGSRSNNSMIAEQFTAGDVDLYGSGGDDILVGGSGNDYLNGGSGNDKLYGNSGFDTLLGGSNNDELYGGSNNDTLKGGSGNDQLHGGDNNDMLDGGSGSDDLYGGNHDDILYGKSGNDRLEGQGGHDTLVGGWGHDVILGGDGFDHLDEPVQNEVSLVDGSLQVTAPSGIKYTDYLGAEIEKFTLTGSGTDDLIDASTFTTSGVWLIGNGGDDTLIGTSKYDVLLGGSGNDTLKGNLGNDKLEGGEGDDTLHGGGGNDTLYGESGDDILHGESGKDTLFGGNDNDIIFGGSGGDSLLGGSGDDQLLGGSHVDFLFGGDGNDGMFGGSGADWLKGDAGMDRYLYEVGDKSMGYSDNDDVKIEFKNTTSKTTITDSDDNDHVYDPASWTDEDVQVVDEAFAVLQQRQGNNILLRTSAGNEMQYVRLGETESEFAAWNSGDTQQFGNNIFEVDENWTHQAVYHEIGHNWDTENPEWNTFTGLSGWTEEDKSDDASFTLSDDEKWFHENSADFARDYGKTNPREDFATSFAAFFMDYSGEAYKGEGAVNIPEKMDFIEDFLDNLIEA